MVWETLVNLVCRPPRYTYDPDDVLGPKRFRIDGRLFERIDVEVRCRPSHVLRCFPASCRPLQRARARLPAHVRCGYSRAVCERAQPDGVMQVMNKRRQRLRCSHYLPILEGNRAGQQTKFPCVVYCHGNCGCAQACARASAWCLAQQGTGLSANVRAHSRTPWSLRVHAPAWSLTRTLARRSRVDASDCLDLLLPQSISVFAFDFSGCSARK